MVLIITALRRIGRGAYAKLFEGTFFVGLLLWDLSLCLVNVLTFKRKIGYVTPKGHPGEGGSWPEYIPPRDGDSRCACPALNALANHGRYPVIPLYPTIPPLPSRHRSKTSLTLTAVHPPQESSLATDATFPSTSCPFESARHTTFLPRSASTSRATSQRSSTVPTTPGASISPTSMYIMALSTMPPSYVSSPPKKNNNRAPHSLFFPTLDMEMGALVWSGSSTPLRFPCSTVEPRAKYNINDPMWKQGVTHSTNFTRACPMGRWWRRCSRAPRVRHPSSSGLRHPRRVIPPSHQTSRPISTPQRT